MNKSPDKASLSLPCLSARLWVSRPEVNGSTCSEHFLSASEILSCLDRVQLLLAGQGARCQRSRSTKRIFMTAKTCLLLKPCFSLRLPSD